jgi:hypothetical protein
MSIRSVFHSQNKPLYKSQKYLVMLLSSLSTTNPVATLFSLSIINPLGFSAETHLCIKSTKSVSVKCPATHWIHIKSYFRSSNSNFCIPEQKSSFKFGEFTYSRALSRKVSALFEKFCSEKSSYYFVLACQLAQKWGSEDFSKHVQFQLQHLTISN